MDIVRFQQPNPAITTPTIRRRRVEESKFTPRRSLIYILLLTHYISFAMIISTPLMFSQVTEHENKYLIFGHLSSRFKHTFA